MMDTEGVDLVRVTILGLLWLASYLLPAVVAYWRGHIQKAPITIVNVFLGWTLVGWVVALAWACSANTVRD